MSPFIVLSMGISPFFYIPLPQRYWMIISCFSIHCSVTKDSDQSAITSPFLEKSEREKVFIVLIITSDILVWL